MLSDKNSPGAETTGLKIERAGDVLTFRLDNPTEENRVTGAMLDAMLSGKMGLSSQVSTAERLNDDVNSYYLLAKQNKKRRSKTNALAT